MLFNVAIALENAKVPENGFFGTALQSLSLERLDLAEDSLLQRPDQVFPNRMAEKWRELSICIIEEGAEAKPIVHCSLQEAPIVPDSLSREPLLRDQICDRLIGNSKVRGDFGERQNFRTGDISARECFGIRHRAYPR